MEPTDSWNVLGLAPGATRREAERAYKAAAWRSHPDRVPAEEREAATEKMQLLNAAYAEVLTDLSAQEVARRPTRGWKRATALTAAVAIGFLAGGGVVAGAIAGIGLAGLAAARLSRREARLKLPGVRPAPPDRD